MIRVEGIYNCKQTGFTASLKFELKLVQALQTKPHVPLLICYWLSTCEQSAFRMKI